MKEVNNHLQKQLNSMQETGMLFKAAVEGRVIWETYLNGFSPENNPIFRDPASSGHNCNTCNSFIRRYGSIVAVNKDFELITLFDADLPEDSIYKKPFKDCSKLLKSAGIGSVFYESYADLRSIGYQPNISPNLSEYVLGFKENHKRYDAQEADKFGVVTAGQIVTFTHFSVKIDAQFVNNSTCSVESLQGDERAKFDVLKRGLEEIPLDTLELVKDLINQGSLLNGDSYLQALKEFTKEKKAYEKVEKTVTGQQLVNWLWLTSACLPERAAKFRNTLLGTLCVELSEGKELNEACLAWNRRADPANYMKAQAPITKSMIDSAKKFVEENGYEESFQRRLATIDDIKATQILHMNSGDGELAPKLSVFDQVKPEKPSRHKRNEFKDIEEVSIDKFMSDILPTCQTVEVFLENRLENNLVTMTTTKNKDSKPIFKWDNNYSWSYKGNLTGKSMIKEQVKTAGGAVDGILRFSISWANGDGDNSDLDAHCRESKGSHIYYSHKKSRIGGELDIDITNPNGKIAVENITYPNMDKLGNIPEEFHFYVYQFNARNSQGFTAEIEMDGEVFNYTYNRPLAQGATVDVARVTYKKGNFSIKHLLPEESTTKEMYGLETNTFHKVSLACLSPNHWGDKPVGNKHYFFMLEGSSAEGDVRGFHNENLNTELLKHRKVMEVLGTTVKTQKTARHLAGVGFNATVRDSVILKLTGNFKRTLKVNF